MCYQEIIVESVPNFSEGRNLNIIESIATAMRSVEGAKLIHIDAGYDANRTVYTLAGKPEAVCEALYRAISVAVDKIDMRTQKGTHPRIGACDVCPLIPVQGISLQDLIPYVAKLAERMGRDFQLPVFFYEASSHKEYRKNLADIRKGEYEGLESKMKSDLWKSDNDQPFNPQTGATVMGVRPLLIAYNVNLESKNIGVAKEIAAKMRYSSGSNFKGLKAIGWMMERYNCAQVSFNITDVNAVSISEVFEKVKELAAIHKVNVVSSELIGLLSEKCVNLALDFYKLPFDESGKDELVQKLGLDFIPEFNLNERIIEKLL